MTNMCRTFYNKMDFKIDNLQRMPDYRSETQWLEYDGKKQEKGKTLRIKGVCTYLISIYLFIYLINFDKHHKGK